MFGNKWFGVGFELFDDGDGGGGGVAAPVDTGDIISQSLGDGGGGEDNQQQQQNQQTDEEKAEEAEIEKIRLDLRQKNTKLSGNIAVDRHQAVLTRARNMHEAAVKKMQEEHQKALKEYEPYKDPEVQAALRAMQLADEDPGKFIQLVMQDPRYAELIMLKQAQQQQDPNSLRPKPNAKIEGTGEEYYNNEGLGALLDFERKRAVEEAKELIMKEFGPLKQNYERSVDWNQRLEQNRQFLENARTNWPGFKENEAAIRDALKANEKFSLDDAYREVVVKQTLNTRASSEADLRKKWLEEMKQKEAAARGSERGAPPERRMSTDHDRDTADIINEALRNQGLI